MKKTIPLILLLLGAAYSATGEISRFEENQQTFYRLSNRYVSAVINPDCGGRVEYFGSPDGINLVTPALAEVAPGGSGLGQERLRFEGATVDRSSNARWQVTAAGSEGGRSFITLENTDSPLHIVKTYLLTDHAASLEVEYAFDNPSSEDFRGNLWFITVPFPEGTASMRYYYPFAERNTWPNFSDGKATVSPLVWPETTGDIVTNSPAAGWAAALNEDGNGILWETSYADLHTFYNWLPTGFNQGTLEALTENIRIRPLAEGLALIPARPEQADPLFDFIYRTRFHFLPLYDFPAVDAADNHIVCAMERRDGRLLATLRADRDYPQLTARCNGVELPLTLTALTDAALEFPLEADAPLVTLELSDPDGRKVARLVKSFDPAVRPAPAGAKNKIFTDVPAHAEFHTDFELAIIPWNTDAAVATRLLLFATAWSHHDTAELLVRGNWKDPDIVEVAYPYSFAFDISDHRSWVAPEPIEHSRRVLQKPHDVIIISSAIRWFTFPEDIRLEIRRQVEEGAGLIYVNSLDGIEVLGDDLVYNEAETLRLNRAVPYGKLNAVKTDPDPEAMPLKVYDCGEGRVVSVDYQLNLNYWPEWLIDSYGLIPNPDFELGCDFNYYDYHFSQILRAVRIAARQQVDPEITAMTAEADTLNLDIASSAAQSGTVTLEIRDKYGAVVDAQPHGVSLTPGDNVLAFDLPADKMSLDGDYFYNAIIRTGGHTADWYTAVQTRNASCALEEFSLSRKAFEPGEKLSGVVRLRGDLDGAALELLVEDSCGRVLYRETGWNPQPEKHFEIDLEARPETILSTARVTLTRDGRVLDCGEATWTTPVPPRSGVTFTSWTSCSNYFSDEYHRSLVELGFDEVVGYYGEMNDFALQRTAAEKALKQDINYTVLSLKTIGWSGEDPLESPVRPVCLRDPAVLEEIARTVGEVVANIADYQPNFYFIGDECSLYRWDMFNDYCHSEYCLAAFRDWLRERYDSLDDLNRAWRSAFAAWDEVTPVILSEAKAQDNLASWIEHRTFMFSAITLAIKTEYEALKANDPDGKLAISGMVLTNTYNGLDWQAVLPYLERAIIYDQPNTGVDDVMRSFASPDAGIGNWNGYRWSVPVMREDMYREILAGLRGNGNWANGYLLRHGDLKPNDYALALGDAIHEIKASGIDVITEPENRLASPFAIYFSIPSMVVSDGTDFPGHAPADKRTYHRNFGGWTALLANLGIQGPMVFDAATISGIDPGVNPFLILPLAQLLSDAEVDAILAYVENGGRLIADVLPGVCYANGTPRSDNPFSSLFGAQAQFRSAQGGERGELLKFNGRQLELELGDPALQLSGGVPALAADRRVMIVGDGHLLLNLLPAAYGRIRGKAEAGDPILDFFRQAFVLAGVTDVWSLDLPPGAEAGRYFLDGNYYLGVTRPEISRSERRDASLRFERPWYIYDLFRRSFLGRSDRMAFDLDPCEVRLLALLPGPKGAFELTLEAEDGRFITALVSQEGTVAGLFRLEVFRPDGTLYKPATGNHSCPAGEAVAIDVDPGLEPMPGAWCFRVIDLLDNAITENSIIL